MSSENLNTLLEGHVASLYEAGKIDDALRVAGTALSNARQSAEDNSDNLPLLVNALETLSDLHRHAGDFEKSESMYKEAIETAKKTAVSLMQMARLRSGLAMLYDFNQREEAALPLYEMAIDDYEKMIPPCDEEASQLRNNLAMIYKSLGKLPLAEQHYLLALETLEKVHGRNNERVSAVFNNLGSLYYSAGHAQQAKEMHLEALEIRLKVFGPDHLEVAQSYSNLATACYDLEDDLATQQSYERSLRILELNLEKGPNNYEEVAQDYIAVLNTIGEEKKAQAMQKRVDKFLKRA